MNLFLIEDDVIVSNGSCLLLTETCCTADGNAKTDTGYNLATFTFRSLTFVFNYGFLHLDKAGFVILTESIVLSIVLSNHYATTLFSAE